MQGWWFRRRQRSSFLCVCVSERPGRACLCGEGNRDSPLTRRALDWVFLIIKRLCDYAMSVTVPMIDKEKAERQNRRQRENSVTKLDELLREEEETTLREKKMHCREGFKDKVELFGWKLAFMVVWIYASSENAVYYIWRGGVRQCVYASREC